MGKKVFSLLVFLCFSSLCFSPNLTPFCVFCLLSSAQLSSSPLSHSPLSPLPSCPFISFVLPSQAEIIYSQVPSKLTLHLGSPRPSPHDGTLTQPWAQSPITLQPWVWFRAPLDLHASFTRVSRRETRQRICSSLSIDDAHVIW
ncbi:hypothetical protein LI328DRAFT_134791 [Trichoderma asperelloides]|nr:hypothetical protein LI328DRAFT_134791 [Trichoderma asperelloides]